MRVKGSFVGHSVVNLTPIQFRHIDPFEPDVLFVNDLDDLDSFFGIFCPVSFEAFAGKPKLQNKK
jgi:hypothetical protein